MKRVIILDVSENYGEKATPGKESLSRDLR